MLRLKKATKAPRNYYLLSSTIHYILELGEKQNENLIFMQENKNTKLERKEIQINYFLSAMEITSCNLSDNLYGRNYYEDFTCRSGN